ncbi:MAG TPA: haloacid dehalogenase [Anaerolineae bacterium]|nr:haloacid dehalogenase [Anaerolineae bacterium]
MHQLESIIEGIRGDLEAKNAARDAALHRSRELIRHCANAIRAAHRGEVAEAHSILTLAGDVARLTASDLAAYPDLYHAGYTQDALKEYVEARLVFAFETGGDVPSVADLGVEGPAFLNGLAEAASELRRHCLDLMRENRLERARVILEIMDEAYTRLMSLDFPDAITGGLRRQTDMLRGVVERTRGDLTTAIRQEMMREALRGFEERLAVGRDPIS